MKRKTKAPPMSAIRNIGRSYSGDEILIAHGWGRSTSDMVDMLYDDTTAAVEGVLDHNIELRLRHERT